MKHPLRNTLLLMVLAVLLPQALAEEKLGRLFLTPERRAMLERQRQLNLQEQKTLEGATIRLDGVIVRSTGKKTLWINGQAQHDNNNLGVDTHVAPGNPNQVEVTNGNEHKSRLRVGQKINRATQEISDGLDGGRLDVKPPPRR